MRGARQKDGEAVEIKITPTPVEDPSTSTRPMTAEELEAKKLEYEFKNRALDMLGNVGMLIMNQLAQKRGK